MAESNDHDLLIALNAKIEVLVQMWSDDKKNSNSLITNLSERMVSLETKDSRDSEKVRAIDVNVQQSLKNHEKIGTLETKMASLEEEMKYLRGRSNSWDIINSIGAGIAAAIGWFR